MIQQNLLAVGHWAVDEQALARCQLRPLCVLGSPNSFTGSHCRAHMLINGKKGFWLNVTRWNEMTQQLRHTGNNTAD